MNREKKKSNFLLNSISAIIAAIVLSQMPIPEIASYCMIGIGKVFLMILTIISLPLILIGTLYAVLTLDWRGDRRTIFAFLSCFIIASTICLFTTSVFYRVSPPVVLLDAVSEDTNPQSPIDDYKLVIAVSFIALFVFTLLVGIVLRLTGTHDTIVEKISRSQAKVLAAVNFIAHFSPLAIGSFSYSFMMNDLFSDVTESYIYFILIWGSQILMFITLSIWLTACSNKSTVYLKPVGKAFLSASSTVSLPEIFMLDHDNDIDRKTKFAALSLLLAKAGSFIEIFIGIVYLAWKNSGEFYSIDELMLLSILIFSILLLFNSVPMGTTIIVTSISLLLGIPTDGIQILIVLNILVDMPGSALNSLCVAFAQEFTKPFRHPPILF